MLGRAKKSFAKHSSDFFALKYCIVGPDNFQNVQNEISVMLIGNLSGKAISLSNLHTYYILMY